MFMPPQTDLISKIVVPCLPGEPCRGSGIIFHYLYHSSAELTEILKIVEEHRDGFVEKWNRHFSI
jgi:hypothetical protein